MVAVTVTLVLLSGIATMTAKQKERSALVRVTSAKR